MSEELDALDAALGPIGSDEGVGTDVIARRMVNGQPVDATCRAHVRSYRLRDEQILKSSDQGQDELLVIMSPTGMKLVGWPAGDAGPPYPQRGDFLIVRDILRSVNDVDPIFLGKTLVRIEMRVLGGA